MHAEAVPLPGAVAAAANMGVSDQAHGGETGSGALHGAAAARAAAELQSPGALRIGGLKILPLGAVRGQLDPIELVGGVQAPGVER